MGELASTNLHAALLTPASARWGHPADLSEVRAKGRIIAICEAPQVLIQTPDGKRLWWRADLTMIGVDQ